MNAARSLRTFVRETDNLLLFDNDAWRETGESVEGGYETINEEIARRFGVLFSAGEIDGAANVAQSVIDSSEVINTLSGGGVSTMGYASETVETTDGPGGAGGLLSRFSEPDESITAGEADPNRITSLVRKAALGRLTLPCEIRATERALVLVAGPPEHLSRKGIESARSWIEPETGSLEVRGGDYPIPGAESLAAVVLLAGVSDVPRIEKLQAVGVEAKQSMDETTETREARLDELMDGGPDPLF